MRLAINFLDIKSINSVEPPVIIVFIIIQKWKWHDAVIKAKKDKKKNNEKLTIWSCKKPH